MMSRILEFFDTSFKVKSEKFLKLNRLGKGHLVDEAIEDEKKHPPYGQSKCGTVKVKRLR